MQPSATQTCAASDNQSHNGFQYQATLLELIVLSDLETSKLPDAENQHLHKPWQRAYWRGFLPRLLLGMVLLNSLVVLWGSWSLRESLARYEAQAVTSASNLAQVLYGNFSATMGSIDRSLQALVDQIQTQYRAGRTPDRTAVDAALALHRSLQPVVYNLRVTDERGMVIYGLEARDPRVISVADRDFFIQLRDNPNLSVVFSAPVRSRVDGRWIVLLARAWRHSDGRFGGMVTAAIPLSVFEKHLEAIAITPADVLTLFSDQPTLRYVVRHPKLDNVQIGSTEMRSGQRYGTPEFLAALQRSRLEGHYRAQALTDGVFRSFSFRCMPELPVCVQVGLAQQVYLAGWYKERNTTVVLLGVFMLMTWATGVFIYRSWCRQLRTTESMQLAYRERDAERSLSRTIVDASPLAIFSRDCQGRITSFNRAAEIMTGWPAQEVLGTTLESKGFIPEEEARALRARVLAGEVLVDQETSRQSRDGQWHILSTTLTRLCDKTGTVIGYLTIAADITERRMAEKKAQFLAFRDALTGLPNRLQLQNYFEQAIAHADRSVSKLALLYVDLDNFKSINDTMGHAVGDAFLKNLAQALQSCLAEGDIISRQGGDEFLLALSNIHGPDDVVPVLAKLRERLQAFIEVDGHELSTSASMGVAIYPDDGDSFDVLLKKADIAMYRAKDAGRNGYRFFHEQMNTEVQEHMRLKNGLQHALEAGEFELYYQPQCDINSGLVVGAEALLRWHHPEQGMVSPARFIPVAEDSGLIVPIGDWVLQQACRQVAAWLAQGLPPLVVAVNLSAVQFRRGDVEQSVVRALQDSGLDPHWLELELTESVLIHDTDNVLVTVGGLKRLGIKLAIDDFGTGYSSLSYLKRFDVDKLKIDQGFVRDLNTDPEDEAIVRAIIQMAHSLGLYTIAEGVEDAPTLARLASLGCDEVQGYYLGRPMPAPAFADYLRAKQASASDSATLMPSTPADKIPPA